MNAGPPESPAQAKHSSGLAPLFGLEGSSNEYSKVPAFTLLKALLHFLNFISSFRILLPTGADIP